METEIGEPNQHQIRDDLAMLALGMRKILEGDGEDGREGPLGPLPHRLLE